MSPIHPSRRTLLSLALVLAAASCVGGPPPVATIESLTIGDLSAGVGQAVSFKLRLLDEKGRPIEGLEVRFGVGNGAGSTKPGVSSSDVQGVVSVEWTLGTTSGRQSLTATSGGKSLTVSAVARPDVPVGLSVIAGQAQVGAAGDPLAIPLVVRVRDRYQNGVPGIDVSFRVTAGGGTLGASTIRSDSTGSVRPSWILGAGVGQQGLIAEASGIAPAEITASAVPGPAARVTVIAGGGQSGQVGKPLAAPILLELHDRLGNLATNGRVELRGDGATIASPAVAGGDGRISVAWTLGTRAGAQTLRAVAGPSDSATVSAVASPGPPATVTRLRGDAQKGWTGGLLADSVAISVKDQYDNAIPGVEVAFAVTGGGGTASPPLAATRPSGEVRTAWRLGPGITSNALEARVPGLAPLSFSAVATSGPPAVISVVSGDQQSAQVTTPLPNPIVLRVRDAAGLSVQGATVALVLDGAGGSITPTSLVTDTTGSSTFRWTLGTVAWPATVTAKSGDAPTAFLIAFGSPGPASAIRARSTGPALWPTGLAVSPRPAVGVVDVHGNNVPGVAVAFDVIAGGGSVTGPNQTTDSEATARVGSWTLGPTPGENVLRARASVGTVDFPVTSYVDQTYEIELRWITPPTNDLSSAVVGASQRWAAVIAGDMPTKYVSLPAGACGIPHPALADRIVDDVLIFAQMVAIDGPRGVLAGAGPCVVRADGSPLVGIIMVDEADVGRMSMDGFSLTSVMAHEMGHVIGIGSTGDWNSLIAGPASDPYFNGAAAKVQYYAAGGTLPNAVPLEAGGGGGTARAHWRESDFGRELMTGYLNAGVLNPLSAVTVGALADMGYPVSYAGADPYAVGAGAPGVGETHPIELVERALAPRFILGPNGELIPLPGS